MADLDLSGPNLIIQAYQSGVALRQQREARQQQAAFQQQQMQLQNKEFQQRKKEFSEKQAEEQSWHDAQVNKYKADFTLEQRKNARAAAVNAYDKGVEYKPTEDEIAYGAQAVTPEMITQHQQQIAQQAAQAKAAETTAVEAAKQPSLEIAQQRDLEKQRLKSTQDATEQTALQTQRDNASMSRTKAEISGRASLAAAEFARKNKVDDEQFVKQISGLITQVSDGTVGLDEIAKSVPNLKERNQFMNTLRDHGVRPLSKEAKGDVVGAKAMLDAWKSIGELNQMLKNAGPIDIATSGAIRGKIDSIESTIGSMAKGIEGVGGRISDDDINRMKKAVPSRLGKYSKANDTKVQELGKFIGSKLQRGLVGLSPVQKADIQETYGFVSAVE